VFRPVRADAVEVTHTRAAIVRRTAGVFKPAILGGAMVHTKAGVDIRGIGFDELRTGIPMKATFISAPGTRPASKPGRVD